MSKSVRRDIDSLIDDLKTSGRTPTKEELNLINSISDGVDRNIARKKEKKAKELNDKLDNIVKAVKESKSSDEKSSKDVVSAIESLKLETYQPKIDVNVPKPEMPIVTVPEIKIPPITIPTIEVPPAPEPKIIIPEVEVKKPKWFSLDTIIKPLNDIKKAIAKFVLPRDADDPVSVRLSDGEKFYRALGSFSSSMGSGASQGKQDSIIDGLDEINTTIIDVSSSPTGVNGGDVSVGTTEEEMTFTGTTESIQIQSKVSNTGSIWVGLTGVTNTGGNALTQLSPGQSISIELNDKDAALYAISDVAAQIIYKAAVT